MYDIIRRWLVAFAIACGDVFLMDKGKLTLSLWRKWCHVGSNM